MENKGKRLYEIFVFIIAFTAVSCFFDSYLIILSTKPYDSKFAQCQNFLFISLVVLISRHEVNLGLNFHFLAELWPKRVSFTTVKYFDFDSGVKHRPASIASVSR